MINIPISVCYTALANLPLPSDALDDFIQLVAFRDYLGVERNSWNDCICVLRGLNIVNMFRCTTDPGFIYRNKVNPEGQAWLRENETYLFTRGKHKPGGPALVHGTPFTVWRMPLERASEELDRNSVIVDGPSSDFGINIHSGNPSNFKEVNGWSQGCVVIRRRDGWQDFIDTCYGGKRGFRKQEIFPLKIVKWRSESERSHRLVQFEKKGK